MAGQMLMYVKGGQLVIAARDERGVETERVEVPLADEGPRDPNAPITYRCETCGRWWTYDPPKVACAVLHGPGHCCHYGEEEETWR